MVVDGLQLEYLQLLGSGASGDVYKGLYKRTHVAIKVLKETAEAEVDEFKKEFEIMSAVRHPNVVFFYGVSTQPRLCMVMEYCSRGSLFKVMKDEKLDFGWRRAISICKETTVGLFALHKSNIFHRDLKSLNLLVTQEWHIKVCDFGLSRFNTNDNMDTMKQMRGTFAYVDPEVYNSRPFVAASDIYSLGIIFWEVANRVVTGKYAQPYSEYKHIQFDFQIVVQAAKSDLRPTIPPKCPPPFTQLIQAVLHKTQEERPSLKQIEEALGSLESSYTSDPSKWDATVGSSR
jgi:serine/threonine protein kinase